MRAIGNEIKTIITDFDETLWLGIIAEGERPKLNRAYYKFLANLYDRGVVLFGLTKNDEADVERIFKELKLNKDIFVTIIANWESKVHNIELLFQQLELRADTALFIDDNPLELNEVKSKIPGIMVLNAKAWRQLTRYPTLMRLITTQKSVVGRYRRYRHALQLFTAKEAFKGDDQAFLYSRKRRIQIGEPKTKKELERVAELFFRTNRLNIYRRPLSSVKDALEYLHGLKESGCRIIAISVMDGGASLGIQGAFTAVQKGSGVLIANGTISCSMISFGDFEKKILNELFKQFFQTADKIEMLVKETPTNSRIRAILREFRFTVERQRKGEYRFSLVKSQFKEQDVPWIRAGKHGKVSYEYFGIPTVSDYFRKYEWDTVQPRARVAVLGIGQGETLGTALMQKFVKRLKAIKAEYFPIDIEDYGVNIIADAEDLHELFDDESLDYIICTELLEHTEHYWNVVNEMLRTLKVEGRIFLSVPYCYPTHEYPIDRWRLSYPYLKRIFGRYCRIERTKFVGNRNNPRHIIMSMVKIRKCSVFITRARGRADWGTGLVYI